MSNKNDTTKDGLKGILSDPEQLAVQMFIDNPLQYEAVRKILLYRVYNAGTLKPGVKADAQKNFALGVVQLAEQQGLSPDVIVRRLLASLDAVNFIEAGFDDLKNFRKDPIVAPAKGNPAR